MIATDVIVLDAWPMHSSQTQLALMSALLAAFVDTMVLKRSVCTAARPMSVQEEITARKFSTRNESSAEIEIPTCPNADMLMALAKYSAAETGLPEFALRYITMLQL